MKRLLVIALLLITGCSSLSQLAYAPEPVLSPNMKLTPYLVPETNQFALIDTFYVEADQLSIGYFCVTGKNSYHSIEYKYKQPTDGIVVDTLVFSCPGDLGIVVEAKNKSRILKDNSTGGAFLAPRQLWEQMLSDVDFLSI